ncbi:unnamed protein product [Caenorhabditis bovis]|uniref:Poly [ADP-ribose] polymerase n=1 Tax=Caenorhabditis bovis TaxID=2654633 RepID=A0A8S1EW42_9PELO|nr:unnamed protein product [Caenorhabditis bovis]
MPPKKDEEGKILNDDKGDAYKVHLCKTDVSMNSNKFYDMEFFDRNSSNQYTVKMINGRIGYNGVTHLKQFSDLEKAKEFFHKKFTEKTSLEWEQRNGTPVPGKYVIVKLANPEVADLGVEEEKPDTSRSSRRRKKQPDEDDELAEKIHNLIKIICDEDAHLGLLKKLKYNEEFGKPLDCLSIEQLDVGYQILKEIEDYITARINAEATAAAATATVKLTMSMRRSGRKPMIRPPPAYPASMTNITNKYYSLIPHSFGFSIPPKIDSLYKIQQEKELLDALRGTIQTALNVKKAKKLDPEKSIYYRLYNELPCTLELVDNDVAALIAECLKFRAPTHYYALHLMNAYEVKKKIVGDVPFKKKRIKTEKMLLWHGTRVTNVFSILMNGLEMPRGPRGDLMFGNGIYFANVPTKSANYCKPDDEGRAFLLLCEVDIHNPLVVYESDTLAHNRMIAAGNGIVFAAGRQSPSELMEIQGVPIYKGGLQENCDKLSELMYDEYVVYDREKFFIKYVIEMRLEKLKMEEIMAHC